MVASHYSIAGERTIPSIGEVLQANAGKTVTISYQAKEYTGEVVGLRDAMQNPAPLSSVAVHPAIPALAKTTFCSEWPSGS